jgi:hypothetical protein
MRTSTSDAVLDLDAMNESATGLDDAPEYRFVGRTLDGSRDIDGCRHSVSEKRELLGLLRAREREDGLR